MKLTGKLLIPGCRLPSPGLDLAAVTADSIHHNGTILTITDATPTAQAAGGAKSGLDCRVRPIGSGSAPPAAGSAASPSSPAG
ncbi:hypothetical protein GCM10011348_21070 [Marinobacterium nitratireducens]|uniref:Uncharacterized protein n=1 Tax=Marinobacterium nitratireducens TaxID=518897 RepID=A0A917ZDV6_9GAMM|nr:hypothetical protein GCM10011348_21070 [Marinobacterium nitratireducens]